MQFLDLPTELIAELRASARAATLSAAAAFGLGGSVWEVLRAPASGMAARTLPPSGPDAMAYVFRRRPDRARQVEAGGAPGGAAPWGIVVVSGDIRPGDRLVSRASPTLKTTVKSLEPWYDYRQGDVDPLPHQGGD